MKDVLQALVDEYENKYPELTSFMQENHQTTRWGMGAMPSYSPAPYICELQGCKPGRMLKKASEPAKHRQCYFLDHDGKIIGESVFAKYVAIKKRWIVYRRFFIHRPDSIAELAFGSALDGSPDANLDSVSVSTFLDNRATGHYTLHASGEYFETLYKYVADKIASITEKIWRETFTERSYELSHANGAPTIFEIFPDNGKLEIFPSN